MPLLPKQKNDPEARFGLKFRKWWDEHKMLGTFELKHAKDSPSIPFSCVDPEQIAFGLAARSKEGVLVRVTVGTTGTSDYIGLREFPTWIVIRFKRDFHVIGTDVFVMEKQCSTRKSLTATRAKEISVVSVPL